MSRVKFQGRTLSVSELASLRREIEGFDTIEVISDEMRKLIEQAFPDLVHRLPPRPRPATPIRRSRDDL